MSVLIHIGCTERLPPSAHKYIHRPILTILIIHLRPYISLASARKAEAKTPLEQDLQKSFYQVSTVWKNFLKLFNGIVFASSCTKNVLLPNMWFLSRSNYRLSWWSRKYNAHPPILFQSWDIHKLSFILCICGFAPAYIIAVDSGSAPLTELISPS